MEFAKKFALVPEEALNKHTPSQKQLSELDKALLKILNSSLPDYEKVQRYYELLQRKMNLQENNLPWIQRSDEEVEQQPAKPEQDSVKQDSAKQEPTTTTTQETVNPEHIKQEIDYNQLPLTLVPSRMKKQALKLLEFLKTSPHKLEWNEKGIVSFKNKKIQNSNIADFFHLIFSTNKKVPINAQGELLQVLKEMHVPQSFIKNKNLLSRPMSTPKVRKQSHVNPFWISLK